MADQPGFIHTQDPDRERRPGTINPMARIAAMTSQAAQAPVPASAPPPAAAPAAPAVAPAPAAQADARPSVGRLEHVDPRHLWATDTAFAAWIAANLESLAEVVNVPLRDGEMPDGQSPVVLASHGDGETAVVVCELGPASDHGFGRLVRSVVASGATLAAWMCGEPGAEYGASVSWLNRAVEGRYFMVKVGAVTIGGSAAAPMFELAVRTPRNGDPDGGAAEAPARVAEVPAPAARRVDDWLESVGARDEGNPEQGAG